jgi:hypothetical protein
MPDAWKDATYQGGPVNKILVIVILPETSVKSRFEDEFVKQLKLHHTDSVASYTYFFHYITSSKKALALSIDQLQTDSVIVARLFSPKKDKIYTTGEKFVIQAWYYDLYSYYSRSYGYMQAPDYVEENDYVIMETNLYEAKNEKLIWSARSEILMLTCGCHEITSFIKVMIDRLALDGFIRPIGHNGKTEQKSS